MTRACTVEGCARPHYGLGYCTIHYTRFKKHGDPLAGGLKRNTCSIEGCSAAVHGQGLCSWHYQRLRSGKDMGDSRKGDRRDRVRGIKSCTVPGCRGKIERGGLCGKHINRRKKLAIIEAKGGKCERCGNTYPPAVYDFHHPDPAEKELHNVGGRYTKASIAEIMERCMMVCANCHRTIHAQDEDENHAHKYE